MLYSDSGTSSGTIESVRLLVDSDSNGASAGVVCMAHSWRLESLRGTNRSQRVEHVRCLMCGERRTRVWMDLPKQAGPDREWRRQ